jgi:hypothetical protein
MKKLLLALAVFFMGMALTVGNASAWYFELDNSDDDLTFDILFNPEGTLRLDNYQLDFEYDTTELASWANAGGSYTNTPPTGIFSDFFGSVEEADCMHDPTPGHLRNFNAGKTGTGPTVSEEILIGTFTFGSLLPVATQDGFLDFTFEDTPNIIATIDGVGYDLSQPAGQLQYGDGMDLGDPSTITPGDINDDDIVDLTDVMLTLQIASGLTPSAPNLDADVNGDGKIGAEESTYVVQMVAGIR